LPSDYSEYTDRPDKFLVLHFANGIWDTNFGEVMGHSATDSAIFDCVVAFANEIGMVPFPIKKELRKLIIIVSRCWADN
jgi:3-hydroxybutyryl-CoA dehydrogenase